MNNLYENFGMMIPTGPVLNPDGSVMRPSEDYSYSYRPAFELAQKYTGAKSMHFWSFDPATLIYKYFIMQEKHLNELTTTAEMGKYAKGDKQMHEMAERIKQDMGGEAPEGLTLPTPAQLATMRDIARDLKKKKWSKRQIRKFLIQRFKVQIVGPWGQILESKKARRGHGRK
jgi:hypothetical protein